MNIQDHLSKVSEYFSPKVIGEVNDVFVKVAKIKGEDIPWHNHANEDEAFFILDGELLFEEEGKEPFMMKKGDFYVVKKSVNHRVSSSDECKIMLIENKSTAHTGEVDSPITKSLKDQLG
ncbi:cupin domain-containing protein [Ekhidna sp. To15]|uniref:cupin domain-containing protein n=1 Tax=Ekhidna sp. To15 TaxID=3395267 RepID=UPI003F520A71